MNSTFDPNQRTAIPPPRRARAAPSPPPCTQESFPPFKSSCERNISESKRLRDLWTLTQERHKKELREIGGPLFDIERSLNSDRSQILDYSPEELGRDKNKERQRLMSKIFAEYKILDEFLKDLQEYNCI